jgi:hypothetical protein
MIGAMRQQKVARRLEPIHGSSKPFSSFRGFVATMLRYCVYATFFALSMSDRCHHITKRSLAMR